MATKKSFKLEKEDLRGGLSAVSAPAATPYYTYGAIPSAEVSADPQEEVRRQLQLEQEARAVQQAREAELQRQQQLVEMQRQQALAAQQAEAARVAEAQRQAEAARQAEVVRQTEIKRQQQIAAQQAEAARAEQQRIAAERARVEQQRAAEERRQAEAARIRQQQEAARIAAEQEAARIAAEQAARAQEPVGALSSLPEESPVGPPPLTLPEEPPVVPTSTVTEPTGTGINQDAMTNLFNLLGQNQSMEPIGGLGVFAPSGNSVKAATPVTQTLADLGLTQAEADEIAKNFNKAAMAPAPLTQLSKEEIAKAAGVSVADLEKSEAEIGAVYEPRQRALDNISTLLKNNDFAGAFAVATKAEEELGQDFIGNIVSPDKFRYLRGPMTADEIKKFYAEMPESVFKEKYVGPGNVFSKEQAIERNIAALEGGSGYADPTLGIEKEETLLSKLPIKELAALAAAAMGATAIPGLFGAGSAGGAGAAGGGAGAAGATGAGALTGVVPTGLIPGAVSAAGLGTATFPIIAGAGLSAAEIAALAAAAGGAGAAASGAGGSTPATQPTPPETGPLEEVVVKAKPPVTKPIIPPVAPPLSTPVELPQAPPQFEPPLEEPPQTGGGKPAPEVETIPEITITATPTPPPGLTLPPIVLPPSTPVTLPEAPPVFEPPLAEPPVEETPPEEGLPEITVTTSPTPPPDLVLPPIVLPPSTPVTLPEAPPQFEPPLEEPPPEEDLPEVTVTTSPTPPPDLVLPPLNIPTDTPFDMPDKPTDVGTPPEEDNPLKDLLDKYGTLENFLKLLGALGSAGAGSKKPVVAPTAPTGGMGGALPKYTYTRKQLSPDIDYYTYGTRPEAKFFEDTVQLEKPVQPPLSQPEGPPATTPDEDKAMATGGLAGYAKGGSKSSRYVDGPGSGREDKIPALLSDGEYVIDAETLALLGDGSTKEGARRMDQFRANIRKHKGRALSRGRISPNAKSPSKYMGGGLT